MSDYTSPVQEVDRGRRLEIECKERPAKRSKYADKGHAPNIDCTHGLGLYVQPTHKRVNCNAASLSQGDMVNFKDLLYANKN
ncbi:hypothetical protein J6590_032476 [Homalodisca vitripennis]|nr:hypothetical protein J6590_032476 [Homalodisca vitripennis]